MTELSVTEIQSHVLHMMRDLRERGVDADSIRRVGVPQPSALIQHLRMRGYEIEEILDPDAGGGRRYRLVTDARITGMRRKMNQMRLGEAA